MINLKSLTSRRIAVFLTYFSLTYALILFEFGKNDKFSLGLILMIIIFFVIFFAGFLYSYILTGIWSFVHRKISNLDERELLVNSNAVKISYSIFSITILILLVFSSVQEFVISIETVAVLILLAHLLPCSVIAWTEKEVNRKI